MLKSYFSKITAKQFIDETSGNWLDVCENRFDTERREFMVRYVDEFPIVGIKAICFERFWEIYKKLDELINLYEFNFIVMTVLIWYQIGHLLLSILTEIRNWVEIGFGR